VRATLTEIAIVVAVAGTALLATRACAQGPPPVPVETRLDQCNAERGTLITESARLNFQLREATSALAANGFELHEGRWSKKKDEPKKDEKK